MAWCQVRSLPYCLTWTSMFCHCCAEYGAKILTEGVVNKDFLKVGHLSSF